MGKIETTFDEAEEAFRRFALAHGYPGDLFWTRVDEVTVWRKHFVVLGGSAEVRRERARVRFEHAAGSGFGAGMGAIGIGGRDRTICYVIAPKDAEDAQYRLMPSNSVKYSVAVSKSECWIIRNAGIFRMLRWWWRKRGSDLGFD